MTDNEKRAAEIVGDYVTPPSQWSDSDRRLSDRIARALDAAEERGAKRAGCVEMLCRMVESIGLRAPGLPDGGFKITPPEGHILTPDGEVVKCPPLPRTKDGAVAFPGAIVYFPGLKSGFIVQASLTVFVAVDDGSGGWRDATVHECYSTREAAEAAKEAREDN